MEKPCLYPYLIGSPTDLFHPKQYTMQTDNRISIPQPCSARWNSMARTEQGRHCTQCNTEVIDFTNNTLNEITTYLRTHSSNSVCGYYQERHTTHPGSKWYTFLNAIEHRFSSTRLRGLSLFLITMLLVLSGCRHKHLSGAYSTFSGKKKTTDQTGKEQVHHRTLEQG
ncbi:MAG TPA: hypothetical protein VNZ86_04285 [Bacteroidia bacterium]|jgi:hypothetical protein|nr:hypothetical protein [Bacteroidia bacterium]